MNLPNGYRDETGTSYSDTWVHQDTKPTQPSPKGSFFTQEQHKEISLHKEWMNFNKNTHNRLTFTEWLNNK